jgi:hypothetical protein
MVVKVRARGSDIRQGEAAGLACKGQLRSTSPPCNWVEERVFFPTTDP